MSNFSFKKRWGHLILLFVCTLSLFIYVNCAYAAIAPDANRTFTHPAEDNQTKNLTLTPDTYTFRTDADPNGGHYVQWYDTYSGTDNCLEEEYLYYYDDHDFSFSSSGNYWVRAEIYDSNWNWQAAYRWYVTIGEPDLIVEDIWLSPASPVEGEEYTVYARVKNVGNAAAGASETGFYIDGDKLYWHINTQALGINDSTDVAYNDLTAPSAGSHTFKAVADIDTAVAESNEINNDDYSESIQISPKPKPDLIIEDIWLSPASPVEGEEYTVYARVKNVGNAAAGASETGFYIDGDKLYWHINTQALGINDSTDVAYNDLTAPSAGSHTFKAVADIDTAVAESNEINNDDYSESISVATPLKPDYIVTKMTIDDKDTNINISPSDMVRLDFWVKNVGDAKGDSSTLRWWYGTSEGDMSVYIGEGSIAGINGLAIGEEEKESDVIWFVPELGTGQYYLVAKADADEEVDEKIEENNVYSIPFSVFHRMEPSYSKGDFEYSPDLGEASDAETSVCGKIPVVLVHGNNGDKKPASLNYWYWWIEQYFNASANVGKFKVYRYIYDSYDHIGEDKDPPVLAENGDENATRFADFINGFDEFQGKKIIIMAHSMGGLVVRSALNNNAELREKTLKLITLGTPHLGSPAANPTWAMSLPSGADLLLTTIGPLFFDGTPGDFDLAWHDINEIPVDVTSIDIINALLNLIAYDWDLLNDSLVSPYTGEIGESYLSDDYILAFGGYLGLFWISSELYDSAPQEVKEELDGDHGGCWLLHDVLAGFEKRDGSNFLYTDGPVPLESAMFDSHPSVNSINITDSAVLDEHLDHSSYLDVARIMDYIMSKILLEAENSYPPNINPINDHATIEGEPYNGPMPSLSYHVLPVAWSLVEGPVGMDIDLCTGMVSWLNPTESGSPHTITIRATNAAGSDDETWFLTVSSSAEAPVIVPISDDSMVEGSPYTGPTPTLSAGTLPATWSLVNNPVGMTINSSTGLVSWPNPTVAGSPHTITIRATNASGSDDESWQLIVTSSGEAPIINPISDDSTIEGEPYTGTTPTLFSGTQPVTWSIADGPSGMTIDSSTGVVSWSSPIVNESPHTITIRATNTEGSDDESWQLIVKQNIVYTITATAGSHGSISPSGTFDVVEESDQQFTAVPDTNYVVDEWYLDGNEVQTGGTIYTLSNVQSDHTVYVMLKEYPTNGWRYTRADVAGSSYYPWGSTELTENTLQEKYSINNAYGSVLTGDVTGNGHLELIYVSGDQLKIYDGTGNLLHSVTLGSSNCGVSMLEDINGDGVLDIGIGTGSTSDLKTYFYNGDGILLKTFSKSAGNDCSMRPSGLLGNGDFVVSLNAGYSHSDMYRAFAVYDKDTGSEKWCYKVGPAFGITSIADFDGDGMLDFANEAHTVHNGCNADGYNNNGTITTDGDIWLIVVDEQGNEKFSRKYSSPSNGNSRHYFVDLNHDGVMEIVGFEGHDLTYYHGTSEIHLFDQNGEITHTFAGSENAGWSFTITDIDGDGKDEVIASNYPGSQTLYVLDHNLAMQNSAEIAGRIQLSCDLNGDGDIEVVLLDDDGNLKVVNKNLQVLNTINVGGHGTVIAGDLDQDGIIELICMTRDHGIHAFNNTRQAGQIKGDINADGSVDLADAILALKVLVGISGGDVYPDRDVNGDGRIGIEEVLYILQKVSKVR